MNILGISAFYHDSAACLVQDGEIVAAAQEERFSRVKHDANLPRHAILYCLGQGGLRAGDVDLVVFYDKPLTKFTRLLMTYTQTAPRGLASAMAAIPTWLRQKSLVAYQIERYLVDCGFGRPRAFHFAEHHLSHAASAFYPSPFPDAAVITVDGVGEWTTTAIALGEGNRLRPLVEQRFPHSLGLLYSAFTYFCGFKVNSGEYKLMGLAPYGRPTFVDAIRRNLVSIREDGSFLLDMRYFGFLDGFRMTNDRFSRLFGGPARRPESEITQREMDLARSIQVVTEEIVLNLARYAKAITGKRNLCMAGGVALNCVANGRVADARLFDGMFVQPAAGDAGGALGAALYSWFHILGRPRNADGRRDSMKGGLLGPSFDPETTRRFLERNQIPYLEPGISKRNELIAQAVNEQRVVGLFQGRMEFGPRALGNRSILADARSKQMQSHLNLATKFRESFRPFAPIVLAEDVGDHFVRGSESPYMLMCDHVRPELRIEDTADNASSLTKWVNRPRSHIPAVTHVDYSARVQTVDRERHADLHDILTCFKRLTGLGVMVNTSFNVRSEPIVCTPEDAYRCFMRTGMDMLVLDRFLLDKNAQPRWEESESWREEFGMD